MEFAEGVLLWCGLSVEGLIASSRPHLDCKPLQAYAPAEVCCVQMRSKKLGVVVPVMSYEVYMGLVE